MYRRAKCKWVKAKVAILYVGKMGSVSQFVSDSPEKPQFTTNPQTMSVFLVTDRISERGNAIISVRLSVRLFVSTLSSEPTDR